MTDFRRILCPIDFSDASRHALEHAVAVGSWFKSQVTGLHVTRPEFVFEPPILFADRGAKALPVDRDQLFIRLNDFMQPTVGARVPWRARLEEGVPAERVLDCARSLPADLIVMGTHGRSGFEHLVLGSVTEKVLRSAQCPVMTVPPLSATAARLPFKHLLCAVDFSVASIEGLDVALSLAEEADANLTVMNVVDWPDDETFLVEAFESADMQKQLEAQTAQRLEALIPDEASVWCRPSTKVVVGKPHREIVTAANDLMADLIVVGVHGRNVVDLTLFGSTTNQVVRRASCPVLTIRARHWDADFPATRGSPNGIPIANQLADAESDLSRREELAVTHITDMTVFDEAEIAERFVRSAGPGHKNIDRDATAVELRLDIRRSALPRDVKERLIALAGRHVTADGVLVVVSRADSSQARNRESARARLLMLVQRACIPPTPRKPTTIGAEIRHERLVEKQRRSAVKRARSGRAQ